MALRAGVVVPDETTLQVVNPSGEVATASTPFTVANPDSMLFATVAYPGSGSASHGVLRFQFDSTGDYIEELPRIPADQVNDAAGALYKDHELFIGNRHGNSGPGSISRFLIDSTGAYVANGTITGNSLSGVHGMLFRPNGELLAANAARELIERHEGLVFPAQVAREFLVAATRPPASNGLGLALSEALESLAGFREHIRLLPEEKPLLPTLLRLLAQSPATGRRIHDAHIVVAAMVHRVPLVVTLNEDDFKDFSAHVTCLGPAEAVVRITKRRV